MGLLVFCLWRASWLFSSPESSSTVEEEPHTEGVGHNRGSLKRGRKESPKDQSAEINYHSKHFSQPPDFAGKEHFSWSEERVTCVLVLHLSSTDRTTGVGDFWPGGCSSFYRPPCMCPVGRVLLKVGRLWGSVDSTLKHLMLPKKTESIYKLWFPDSSTENHENWLWRQWKKNGKV